MPLPPLSMKGGVTVKAAIATRWQKVLVTAAMCAVFVLALAAPAMAIEYGKLTEGVEDELALAVPAILVLLGTILGVSWAIRFVVSKLRSAR